MTVQFGLYHPQFKTDAASMIASARLAERAGFDSFWLMDHLLAPGAPPCDTLESWTLLSALAASTTHIRLGHLVGCNPFRHPSLLAKMAATLDQISGGRLDLGLGWGSVESELAAFGFEVGPPWARSDALRETLEILDLMFAGEVFDYAGDHFQLRQAFGRPIPVQSRIPIHIGGGGRTLTMPLVAEHADWWNCVGGSRDRLDELAPLRGSARISAQYAVGVVHRDAERSQVVGEVARRMPVPAWGRPFVGTAEELVELFSAEADRGVELFVLRFHDLGRPESVELFGRRVAAPMRAAFR